jgi:hypothetical protein
MLEEAAALGAGFEGWKEHFRRDLWSGLVQNHPVLLSRLSSGLDPSIDPGWSFIDAGSSVAFLRSEYGAFLDGRMTPDCREAGCQGCGACDHAAAPRVCEAPRTVPVMAPRVSEKPPVATLRIRFSRGGLVRFSSQLDLIRLWMRVVRRAGLPVSLTSGHVTRPRVRFGPALPLGFESSGEYIDILLSDMVFDDRQFEVQRYLPEGFGVTGARLIPGRISSPEGEAVIADYEIGCSCIADPATGISVTADVLGDLLGGTPGLIGLNSVGGSSVTIRAKLGTPGSRPDRIVAEAFPDCRVLVRRIEIFGDREGSSVPLLLMHEGVDLV